ncbi:MAG: DUF6261 family protein [Chitinophagaceae bacterium]
MTYKKFQIVRVRIKHDDLISLCDNTLKILHSFEDELDELLKGMIKSLETALEKFKMHTHTKKASRLTAKIKILDTERDKNWTEIKRAVSFNLTLRNLDKSNAAKIVDEFLKPYGNVKILPFDTQTQITRNMIKALNDKEEIYNAILELELMPLFEELDHWNEIFDAIFVQRQIEYNQGHEFKYKEIRQILVLNYLEICTHLEHLINFPSIQKYKCISRIFEKMNELKIALIKKYQP